MLVMSTEKKATKAVGATGRKPARLVRKRRTQKRDNRPYDIIGCFALLHAVRSTNSNGRSRTGSERTATS
jgi:hypothetical protein